MRFATRVMSTSLMVVPKFMIGCFSESFSGKPLKVLVKVISESSVNLKSTEILEHKIL